jgi:predicted TIM-barrel fold metal-dependent hydrolase
MQIIDSHVHFWDLKNKINSWVLKQCRVELQTDYLPSSMVSGEKSNIYGFVHVEAHDSAISTLNEIKWLRAEMEKANLRYKHIAFADITQPFNEFKLTIDSIRINPNVVGIRHILAHHPKFKYNPCDLDLSNNKNIGNNILYLAESNLIFNCQLYPYQIRGILPAIENCKITTLLDHILLPIWNDINDKEGKLWCDSISEISTMENVYLKLSGLDMFQDESKYTEVINECLNRFPYTRILYGTNFPVSFTHDYTFWYKVLDRIISTSGHKKAIFYENAFNLFFKNE